MAISSLELDWTLQFSSVAQLSPVLCNSMDCSKPGFPVHQLPALAQTHVHWVVDAIQLSHPLSPLSPPAFNLSQHQSLFQWVSASHQEAKGLEFQLQHQSFPWVFMTDWQVWSPYGPRDSQESSPTLQFKSISSSAFGAGYYHPNLITATQLCKDRTSSMEHGLLLKIWTTLS